MEPNTTLTLPTPKGPWTVAFPREKLLARGRLPGAYGYDLAAHAFRRARAAGVPALELLAAALPTSWMVNARAPSPVFQRWLQAPLRPAWEALLGALSQGPDGWLGAPRALRDGAADAVEALSLDGHGATAVSKVLALLCPEAMPLLDDAAVAKVTGLVPAPTTADAPTVAPAHVPPTLDAFCGAVLAQEGALIALARGYPTAPLDAAQVLDRLLWFESWGWRLFAPADPEAPRWCHVRDGMAEAIVPVPGPHPPMAPGACVDLLTVDDRRWVSAARESLAGAE
ncbi:MAG: hypothetical protein HY909_13880 [Deltaproteobacteria bacterium]|nr:hypothetical protein [Deltaproteobacteria bacterium]